MDHKPYSRDSNRADRLSFFINIINYILVIGYTISVISASNDYTCWVSSCWEDDNNTLYPCRSSSNTCVNITDSNDTLILPPLFPGEKLILYIDARAIEKNTLQPIDVVFIIDKTGSMIDDLQSFYENFDDIIEMLKENSGSVRVAIIPYGDFIDREHLAYFRTISSKKLCENDPECSALKNTLQAIISSAGGGYECQENTYEALFYAINEKWADDFDDSSSARWRPNAIKLIYVITDAAVFPGYWDDMRRLASIAIEKRIFIIGLTPLDSVNSEAKSPCPPTCPPCLTYENDGVTRSKCQLRCELDRNGQEWCVSKCCSGLPPAVIIDGSWQCEGGSDALCSVSRLFIPGRITGNPYDYVIDTTGSGCYDLINITEDTGGIYLQGFLLSDLKNQIINTLELVDYIRLNFTVIPPENNYIDVNIVGNPISFLETCTQEELISRGSDEFPPCHITKKLRIRIPENAPAGHYSYDIHVYKNGDYDNPDILHLIIVVKPRPKISLEYYPYNFGDRIICFFNLTNTGSNTITPDKTTSRFYCNKKEGKIYWCEKNSLSAGESCIGLIDCSGYLSSGKNASLYILGYKMSYSWDYIIVHAILTDANGEPIASATSKSNWEIYLNEERLNIDSIEYNEQKKVYKIKTNFSGLKDGYNLINIKYQNNSKSESGIYLKTGNKMYFSAYIEFGSAIEEWFFPEQTMKNIVVKEPDLNFSATAIYTHHRDKNPVFTIKYTPIDLDILFLQKIDRLNRKIISTINYTTGFTGVLNPNIDFFPLDNAYDIYIGALRNKTANRTRLTPILDILDENGLSLSSLNKIEKEKNKTVSNTEIKEVINYNLTLYRPGIISTSISVSENIPVNIRISSKSENIDKKIKVTPESGRIKYPRLSIETESELIFRYDTSQDYKFEFIGIKNEIIDIHTVKYQKQNLTLYFKVLSNDIPITNLKKSDFIISKIEGNHMEISSLYYDSEADIYTLTLSIQGIFTPGKKMLEIDVLGDEGQGHFSKELLFSENKIGVGYRVKININISEPVGSIKIQTDTATGSYLIQNIDYIIKDAFVLHIPEKLDIVPTSKSIFLFTIKNNAHIAETYTVCGYGDSLKIILDGEEITSRKCKLFELKPGQSITFPTEIMLLEEKNTIANFFIRVSSDENLNRQISIPVDIATFSRSEIHIKDCKINKWEIICNIMLINGGNINMDYYYGISPEFLINSLSFHKMTLSPKESNQIQTSVVVLPCELDNDEKALLRNIGIIYFVAKLHQINKTYNNTYIISNITTIIQEFSAILEKKGEDKTILYKFLANRTMENSKQLVEYLERVYTSFYNKKKKTCKVSRDKKLKFYVFSSDVPFFVKNKLEHVFVFEEREITTLKFPYRFDITASPEILAAIDDRGAINMNANENKSFGVIIENKLHFGLLFNLVVTASSDINTPLFTLENIYVDSQNADKIPVYLTLPTPGRYELYFSAYPLNLEKETHIFELPVNVISGDINFTITPNPVKINLTDNNEARVRLSITNNNYFDNTYIIELKGEISKYAPYKKKKISVKAKEKEEIEISLLPPDQDFITGNIEIYPEKNEKNRETIQIIMHRLRPSLKIIENSLINTTKGMIKLKNSGDAYAEIKAEVSGMLASCISLQQTSYKIEPGATREIIIKNQCEQSGEAILTLTGDNISEKITLKISTTSKEKETPTPEITEIPPQPEAANKNKNTGILIFLLIALLAGAGYLFSIKKRKTRFKRGGITRTYSYRYHRFPTRYKNWQQRQFQNYKR